jgi:hypothetical protein
VGRARLLRRRDEGGDRHPRRPRAWATPHTLAAATGASLDQVAAAIEDLDAAREIARAFVAPC